MRRPRRNHGATFKAQVALAANKGDKMLAELAEQFSVQPTQITDWKQQLLAQAVAVFGGSKPPSETPDLKTLHAKIGQLTLENKGASGFSMGTVEPSAATVNRRLEILHVPEPAGHALGLLSLAIEPPHSHRGGHRGAGNDSGRASNTRRFICTPTRPSAAAQRGLEC